MCSRARLSGTRPQRSLDTTRTFQQTIWATAAEILDLRTAMQRLPDKLERKRGMYYLATKTLPTAIPTGYVLVHNHIRHRVNTPSGIRGFRAWFQKPSDRLEQCDCGWSGLPHYRVKLK